MTAVGSRCRPRRAPRAAVLAGVLGTAGAPAGTTAPSDARLSVRFADDRLSVRIDDVPRAQVLAALADATGAVVQGKANASDTVSAAFDGVPLHEALARLLGTQSFALTYDEGGRVRRLVLFGSAAGRPGAATEPDGDGAEGQPAAAIDFDRARREVRVGGRLARTLGSRQVTVATVMRAAALEPDARVRRDAMRVGMRVIERDAVLRGELFGRLSAADDAAIATAVRRMLGAAAEAVLGSAADALRTPELRARAERVLHALRDPPAPPPKVRRPSDD